MWRKEKHRIRKGNAILKFTLKWEEDGVRDEDFDYIKTSIANLIDNVKSDPKWRRAIGVHQPNLYRLDVNSKESMKNPPKGRTCVTKGEA